MTRKFSGLRQYCAAQRRRYGDAEVFVRLPLSTVEALLKAVDEAEEPALIREIGK